MAYQQQYSQHGQQPYYDQGRPQQRQPQQQQQHQQQQYSGYDSQYDQHYDQHYYDYGYDQAGYEQYDDGYYDQQGRWVQTQQHGGYNDMNAYQAQPAQNPGRRPPPQNQYAHDPAHDGQHRQHRSPPRQDPRGRPAGRGNQPPPGQQQGRGGLRPPGLDRSMLQPQLPKTLPQDNPFPTFPGKKPHPPPQRDNVDQAMSKMNINDGAEGQERSKGSPPRGQAMSPQSRGQQPPKPDFNGRQDSGHFEGNGSHQRLPPNRGPPGQRPPPMNMESARGAPPRHPSDPKSPSQRMFGANTQRSATMPQNMSVGGQARGFDNQQQWAEQHDTPNSVNAPPRPSTAGGVRQTAPQSQPQQRPAMPPMPASQQQQYQAPSQNYQAHDDIDNFYDDYYGETNERKSVAASEIDMPNFDAIPDTNTRHRRGDSIDNHLTPAAPGGPSRGFDQGTAAPAAAPQNNFQQQALRSRSQPDLHGQYANGAYEMPGDAPPMPALPRANTSFEGQNGLPAGPRARGLPTRGMTVDGAPRGPPNQGYNQPQNFDPRYGRQPPPVQRMYSDESAYSEPPLHTMRSVSSPMGAANSIHRPGTAAPAPGRMPSDPLGRRPGTAQPQMNPDALPAHPAPVRPGLMQHNQQRPIQSQDPPPGARPPPIRQYNSENSRASYDSQYSNAQRQSAVPHPVTHDELNRLRNTWRANPADNATGLLLAKKLVEAASVLADEGGTADNRTRNKNREKFILEGHKIIKKLASSGYAEATFYLADCYGQGLLGLQVDTKEAFLLYQSGAKAGHAASAYRTAVCCEMGHEEGGGTKKDPLKAVQWYRRAAALGDTPAMYKMGMILLKGLLGQQKNAGEAINMLKRAADRADRDNPHALHELALIYEAQPGNERIIQDETYALQLFHQAADLGYKFSQFRLGQAYEYGLLGCPIDARTSIAWYTKAAAQEEHQSELALSGWYLTGTQGILEQSDTEAYLWARKAACAEPPLPKALFAMGYFTEVGIGCPRSLDEAKRWYGRAASYKFPKAQERLEELKRGGSKAQMKRERLSRTNQKQQEENCTVM